MPDTGEENIFSALFRWGEHKERGFKGEDFYTKSLVLILCRLRKNAPELMRSLLNNIFPKCNIVGDVPIIINHVGRENRPDIIIDDDRNLIYIEVKVRGSSLKQSDLESYRKEVNEKAGQNKKPFLFALTCYGHEDGRGQLDDQASWISIWRHLCNIEEKLKPKNDLAPEAYYLVRDFRKFLKENGMGTEQVDGIPKSKDLLSFVRYMNLIRDACKGAGLTLDNETKKRVNIDYNGDPESDDNVIGWWFKDGYWCGFRMNAPIQILFELNREAFLKFRSDCKQKKINEGQLESKYPGWEPPKNDANDTLFPLPSMPGDFENWDAPEQVQHIKEFVEEVLHETGVKLSIESEN